MSKATRIVAVLLGLTAGLSGAGHGYFEILQGNTQPDGVVIASIGPPCDPDRMYSACEPAMTIVPNFLITGILAVIIGILIMVWSAGFIHRSYGGWVMIALSIALLLFGGGFFPPLIGMIAGLTANGMNKEFPGGQPGRFTMLMARMWPWPLVIFLTWVYGQLLVGHFFNDFMQQVMIYGVALILITLILSVISANAKDRIKAYRAEITTTSGESI